MPELPEIEALRIMLESRACGQRIERVVAHLPRIIRGRRPLEELVGARFAAVLRRGKYLIFPTDNRLTMFAHMGMTGTLLWGDTAAGDQDYVRAELQFSRGRMLYRDPRTLGGLWVLSGDEKPWNHIGIEPFDDAFSADYLLGAFRRRMTPIKTALMDQSIVAGVGNIYSSEALFAARIDPRKPACKASRRELARLCSAVKSTLRAAIDARGTTFRDFRLSNGTSGGFQGFLKVYGRGGKLCPRCGNPIKRVVISQRSSYFCDGCQK